MSKGALAIISAPSGAGKTTLIKHLMADADEGLGEWEFSVSHTTRPRRVGEVEGEDYHFVEEEEFRAMLARDEFLEWADVYGQAKGTSKEAVLPRLDRGTNIILDIDTQGARQVFGHYPEAEGVLILPPSYAELDRRIRARGGDTPEQLERRLAESLPAIESYAMYGYVMINDDLSRAHETLRSILIAIRHRREHQSDRVESILGDFKESLERRT